MCRKALRWFSSPPINKPACCIRDAAMGRELIVVRSLTESDLGIFAAHRAFAKSRQRAININAPVARELLSGELFEKSGGDFDCICRFGEVEVRGRRSFLKTAKNWRLGGAKIEGEAFAKLDCKDFVLIRSVVPNDGTQPITITFVGRKSDRVVHAGIGAIVGKVLEQSMAMYPEDAPGFLDLAKFCPVDQPGHFVNQPVQSDHSVKPKKATFVKAVPPMPKEDQLHTVQKKRTIHEKLRAPHILERMLQVAGDLSAPAQLRFMETVERLAYQLRKVLLQTGGIISISKNHASLWRGVAGRPIGFVDGGLANLSMFGSAPIAARVGGYVVTPGERGASRERFTVLKYLIDELYAHGTEGVYRDSFPDIGALRDAARIAIEAAGAVKMLSEHSDLAWVMVHGALVNPVSRYTDVMWDGKVRHHFPNFSDKALSELLPSGARLRSDRDRNFIGVHLKQLELLSNSSAVVCGVVERESTTTSVCRAVLNSLDDNLVRDILPVPPQEWKYQFRSAIDPFDADENEGQRITDSLLFRCVLEPGEALSPVVLDRNEIRKAPDAWKDVIIRYPKPRVSYIQATEWSSPIRVEMFEKDHARFFDAATLIMHCALLLPRYAFPVGLDIVDKFARIPDWMSKPVNTHTAVRALKRALDSGDVKLFDALRRMLCGSRREWLLRPTANR